MKKYLGLDIGGTNIKYILMSEEQEILEKGSIKTITENKEAFYESLESLVNKLNTNKEIQSIGIGFPGAVNTLTGEIKFAVNLGFDNLDLKSFFNDKWNIDSYILNDANAAAYGEYKTRNDVDSMLFLTLGTGLGGGIVLNKELYFGKNFSAGEVGHIPIESDERRICGCGNTNCIETFVSKKGILKAVENYESIIKKLPTNYDVKEIFDLYKKGNQDAVNILESIFDKFSKVVAGIVNTLDIESVVIGGGIAEAGNELLEIINKSFDKYLFPTLKGKVKIEISSLRNDAGSLGSVYYAMNC